MKSFPDFPYNFSIFQNVQRAASKGPKSRSLATLALDKPKSISLISRTITVCQICTIQNLNFLAIFQLQIIYRVFTSAFLVWAYFFTFFFFRFIDFHDIQPFDNNAHLTLQTFSCGLAPPCDDQFIFLHCIKK